MASRIIKPPPDSGEVELGRTLPSLLDEALRDNPNPRAFNQPAGPEAGGGWETLSTAEFAERADALALALLDSGLQRGDRVGFFTESDFSFSLPDMACLIAGLIDVPIYLTHTPKAVSHILHETEARALLVSDDRLFDQVAALLGDLEHLERVIFYRAPSTPPEMPEGVEAVTVDELLERGRYALDVDPERPRRLRDEIRADDLATIIYTSGTTGLPKGVMLTHENISSNAIAAFTGLPSLQRGPDEVALSFLPLSHIFARTLLYCTVWYGTTIYYSDPDRMRDHLREVRPTFFAAVPRVLEKAFERIMATGESLTGVKRRLFDWSMQLAGEHEVGRQESGLRGLQHALADRLVFSKWREALGGRVHTVVVGGAALRPELVTVFDAGGVRLLQGYGLTETSPVVTFNRPFANRPGTVGQATAGTEMTIDADGEVLTRGPHVMKGYYGHDDKTAEVIDESGWFHTGDLGEITDDGFLKITGRKKNLFKLSTGKYVMPQPLEDELEGQPIIDAALVVGEGEKYCAALLFLNQDALEAYGGGEKALADPTLQARLRELIAEANRHVPSWSTVKRVALTADPLSTANGLLTPKLSVKREVVLGRYPGHLEALYGRGDAGGVVVVDLDGDAPARQRLVSEAGD